MSYERIDKILASQGTLSRADVKALVKNREVKLNGKFVEKSDQKADPEHDIIEVSGKVLNFRRYIYIMMNKPSGVLSAANDKSAKTVIDLVPKSLFRNGLFPAGRLDKDTEGLLIITDDGDFAHRMLSPKHKVYKLYHAKINGKITQQDIELFKKGLVLSDGTQCLPAELEIVEEGEISVVSVKICEGKFHQVKKMLAAIGHEVLYLKRIQIGSLTLFDNLHRGECRELTNIEKDLIFY
ncbi:MAG: pseudouridine synthase [Bacillota bacterium]|nr:pseudouridine synthase [Bacillota bacterium]